MKWVGVSAMARGFDRSGNPARLNFVVTAVHVTCYTRSRPRTKDSGITLGWVGGSVENNVRNGRPTSLDTARVYCSLANLWAYLWS